MIRTANDRLLSLYCRTTLRLHRTRAIKSTPLRHEHLVQSVALSEHIVPLEKGIRIMDTLDELSGHFVPYSG